MKHFALRIMNDKDYDNIVAMSKRNKRSINKEIEISIEKHTKNEK